MRHLRTVFAVLTLGAALLFLLTACTESESPSPAPSTPDSAAAPEATLAPVDASPTEQPAPAATTAPEPVATEPPAPAATAAPEPAPTGEPAPIEEPEVAIGLVAFAEGGRIGLARPAQLDSVFLTTGPGDFSPVWSPDGNMIAFARFAPAEARGTYVMNADGSGLVKVADTANIYNRPVWSPNGNRIALMDRRPDTYGVWVVDADGSNPVRLYEADRTLQHLAWSPDGETIAFTWNRGSRDGGLYIVPADGSAEAQVVIESDANYLTRAGAIAWSPDGQLIAVRARPLAPRGEENPIVPANQPILTIVQVNPDGTFPILHRIQNMALGEWYPAWAPNGRTVATITVKEDGTQELSVISALGGETVPLSEAAAFGSPSWSPGGGSLVVTAYTADNPSGALRIVTLADIGMEWNMSMDMTTDMEAALEQQLRTGIGALWSPIAGTDTLPSGTRLTIGPEALRIASFTFSGFT